eukprot:TRINITY_DN3710_c0_g1_i1.p1 TRINITY_DN3710_c0_g1~~TRINITY_DN3710_c0_g1_i1.p1  ORF type:complete len:63 (+),score=7.13 TRINITY_DN3710_c0_g1_i1:29-190(+)
MGTFPSGCYSLPNIEQQSATLRAGEEVKSCKGGEVLVAKDVCCPLSEWTDFKF